VVDVVIVLALTVVFVMFVLDEFSPLPTWVTVAITWALCWFIIRGAQLPW
jgi:hypothetical protein